MRACVRACVRAACVALANPYRLNYGLEIRMFGLGARSKAFCEGAGVKMRGAGCGVQDSGFRWGLVGCRV